MPAFHPPDLKIFLVDDDLLNLKVTKFHLNRIGFNDVTLFDNGLDCISHLSLKPAVILLDQYMYGIDGLDVLKKVKQLNPEIKVIMLSAEDSERSAIFFKTLGASDYIVKGKDALGKIEAILTTLAAEHALHIGAKLHTNSSALNTL